MPLDSVVRCRFLGHTQIEVGHVLVTPEAERLFALLTVLACEAGKTFTRDELAAMLWADMPDERGKHNLRQTVYKARQCGVPLAAAGEDLRLDPSAVWKDWEAPDGPIHGDWLGCYTGAFSDPYAGWLLAQRAQVNAELRPRLVQAMSAARTSGDLGLAERLALQVLKLDAFNEEATLVVAECRAMAGAKVDALAVLDEYSAEVGSGEGGDDAALPARVLRSRIAERLPVARYVADAAHQLPLAGREEERRALLSALYDIQGGRGASTWLWGPEGSGKTRLVAEVVKSATINGLRLVTVDGSREDEPGVPALDPWRVLREACAQLLVQPGALGAAPEQLAEVQRFVSAGQLARSLAPEAQGAALAAVEPPPSAAVGELLAAIAEERAVVVVVDGVAPSELAAVTVLTAALDGVACGRAGVVATSRLSPRRLGVASPGKGVVVVAVGPMAVEELQAVLEAWIGVTQRVRAREHVLGCAMAAEGNPMFALELLGQAVNLADRDAVPFAVRRAFEKSLHSRSELTYRLLCAVWIGDAELQLEALALMCKTGSGEVLAEAVDLLEDRILLQSGSGYRLSTLFGLFAASYLEARLDHAFIVSCAKTLRANFSKESDVLLLFRSYGLLARCQHSSLAASWVLEDLPDILKHSSATDILDRIAELRDAGALRGDLSVLDAIATEVANRVGRQLTCRPESSPSVKLSQTLPATSPEQVAFYRTLRDLAGYLSAKEKAQDVSREHTERARSAIDALVISDNYARDDFAKEAAAIFQTICASGRVRVVDETRGHIICGLIAGDLRAVNLWSDRAKEVSREAADVGDACTLLRTASHAQRSLGNLDHADSLATLSLDLALENKYWIHAIFAHQCFAATSVSRLDATSTLSHVSEAVRYHTAYGAGTPFAKFNSTMYLVWAKILAGSMDQAARELDHLLRITPTDGAQVLMRQVHALRALLLPEKKSRLRLSAMREVLDGFAHRRPDEQEDRNMYALITAADRLANESEIRLAAAEHLARKRELGYALTPIAEKLVGTQQ